MTGKPWDASYADGPAPWEFGGAQPAVVRLAAAGGFRGAVLDAGCGSGANALHLAASGLSVLGVDVAATAVGRARQAANERGLDAEFEVEDALHLERLGRRFDTILDSALFHTFDADERPPYVESLTKVIAPGGTLYVLCFSDEGADIGPHPVARDDLTAAFGTGWNIDAIEATKVETRFHENGAPAWLATIKR